MARWVAAFLIFFILAKTILTQKNPSCVTPNNETGSCISLSSCQVIVDALKGNTQNAIDFAKKSKCGREEVCCGSTGFDNLPELLINIFTTPQSSLPNETNLLLPNKTICGLGTKLDKILGGQIAEMNEFPWVVALEYKSKINPSHGASIRCGGSLISNRYVLTAAHCLENTEFKLIRVWLGDWKISTDPDCLSGIFRSICNDPVVKVNISGKIAHPYYLNGQNDIGLVKLDREVQFTNYVRPVCLPLGDVPKPNLEDKLMVAGWGATHEDGHSSDYKKTVEIPLRPIWECKQLSKVRRVDDKQLCAGGEAGKDSCGGDSGGPLMMKYNDGQVRWYLEGIVSWGDGCGIAGKPAVYTRVSKHLDWIMRMMSELE